MMAALGSVTRSRSLEGGPVTDAPSSAPPDPRIVHIVRGTMLTYWAGEQPDAVAIISAAGNRTFGELNTRANQLVRALRRRGVEPGAAVALMCRNRPEFAEVWGACSRGGYRLTPINWHLTGEEAGYIVDDCEAQVFVGDARHGAAAADAASRAPGLRVCLAVGGEIDGFESYDDALAAEDGSDLDDPMPGGQMLYTSGTTGRPKGVTRDMAALAAAPSAAAPSATVATARLTAVYSYVPGEDLHLCTGPLYHAAPLAFSLSIPLASGVAIVLMDGWDAAGDPAPRRASTASRTRTWCRRCSCRLLKLPPDVRERHDLSTLRNILHGAAPCPPNVKQRADRLARADRLRVLRRDRGRRHRGRARGVARAARHRRARRPAGSRRDRRRGRQRVPARRGRPRVPQGARRRPLRVLQGPRQDRVARTAATTSPSATSAIIDDDGYLFLTDRSANLIISGGVNIYPAEVDAVLLEHPAVRDVATIGVPDPEWGESVLAVVRAPAGRRAVGGARARAARLHARAARALQVPARRRIRRRAPARGHRQDLQAQAPRRVPRAHARLTQDSLHDLSRSARLTVQ